MSDEYILKNIKNNYSLEGMAIFESPSKYEEYVNRKFSRFIEEIYHLHISLKEIEFICQAGKMNTIESFENKTLKEFPCGGEFWQISAIVKGFK